VNFIGRQVETFTLLRELAKGASTRVFLVSDGQVVKALKVFLPQNHWRAERELEVGLQLEHPHLNPVEALIFMDDHPCILMPLMIGQRLGFWLEGAPLSAFLQRMIEVLCALDYLHGKNIIHRDLKPDNIMVTRNAAKEPSALLFDFDLAVYSSADKQPQTTAGTAAYFSPEQATGLPVTPASDLYSAGIILYRGITGEVPFTGSFEEVLEAHRELTPEPVSSFQADVFQADGLQTDLAPFDELLEQLLAKEPEDRFASAADVIEELEALQKLYAKPMPEARGS